MEGHGYCEEKDEQQRQREAAASQSLVPALRQRGALTQMPPAVPHRQHKGRPERKQGHHGADQQVFRGDEPDQADGDEQPVHRRQDAVDRQPDAFTLHLQRRLGIARAEGAAKRFLLVYDQYRLAKEVTKKRIYLETMERVFRDMNKVIIDSGEGGAGAVVPYLPLPEIQKRAAGARGDG